MSTDVMVVGLEVRMSGNRAVPRVAFEFHVGGITIAQLLEGINDPKVLFDRFEEEMRLQYLVRNVPEFIRRFKDQLIIEYGEIPCDWGHAFEKMEKYQLFTWWIHIED